MPQAVPGRPLLRLHCAGAGRIGGSRPTYLHQTTLNQFFTESQFESYRALGYCSAKSAFYDIAIKAEQNQAGGTVWSNRAFFTALFDRWVPPPPDFTRMYLQANEDYIAIHRALGRSDGLRLLNAEIYPAADGNADLLRREEDQRPPEIRNTERNMVAQMFTVLESAYFGLDLRRYRHHPVHTGWMEVCHRWLRSPTVLENWEVLRQEFSQEFQEFIEEVKRNLVAPRDKNGSTRKDKLA